MLQVDFLVNIKSLYRLTGTGPVQKIDLEIVRAICAALKVEIGDLIQLEKPKFELMRQDPASQEELDKLMDKNNEGQLTEEEQVRFNALLERVQRITLHNSKLLVDQKRLRESRRRARDGRVEGAGWAAGVHCATSATPLRGLPRPAEGGRHPVSPGAQIDTDSAYTAGRGTPGLTFASRPQDRTRYPLPVLTATWSPLPTGTVVVTNSGNSSNAFR